MNEFMSFIVGGLFGHYVIRDVIKAVKKHRDEEN